MARWIMNHVNNLFPTLLACAANVVLLLNRIRQTCVLHVCGQGWTSLKISPNRLRSTFAKAAKGMYILFVSNWFRRNSYYVMPTFNADT